MLLKSTQLAGLLARAAREGKLAPVWVVTGDEPLLVIEACDAIRAAARAQGYAEREVLTLEARSDWSRLAEAAAGLSLFATRKLVELRLPSGKPGKNGAEALERHAAGVCEDVLTVLSLPRLDKAGRESRWFSALAAAGQVVEVLPVTRGQLPGWIGERLRKQGQSATAEVLEFIADRVEGNLLAAHQEIGKLGLLFPERELALAEVREAVLNVARYDIGDLQAAVLAGDAPRCARTLAGLQAEGAAIPLVLWVLLEEIRAWLRVRTAVDAGRPYAQAAREARVWGPREDALRHALPRVDVAALAAALTHAADIDRLAKGLRAPERDSDPWVELRSLVTQLATGIRTA